MKRVLKATLILLLVAAVLAGVAWYLFTYQTGLISDFLRGRGNANMEQERYARAAKFYQYAWDLEKTDYTLAVALADAYKQADNYTKAEYTLVNAISALPEQIELYTALSETYVEQDKLLDASQLLDQIASDDIRQQLEALRPATPVLSPESGYYTEYISVSLTVESGEAYLALDGGFPSMSGGAYTEPVPLPGGESKVAAVAVGENGLVSSAVYGGYVIGGVVEPITLEDDALDTYVRGLLNKGPDDTLMTNELWELTELEVPQGVTTLQDLSNFTGLTTLTIHNFHGEDFSSLSALTKLETLDLAQCSVSTQTVALLGGLEHLRSLNLAGCGVTNLEGLSPCSTLEILDLTDNQVTNLAPINGCEGLRELRLSGNAISALDAVGALHQLEILDLSYNTVQNLGALRSCTKLAELNLSHCNLVDVSALGALTSLKRLTLSSNGLSNIAGLDTCTSLEYIDLSDNVLESIGELGNIDALKEVNANYNDIRSVPAFTVNSKLEKFYADHNFMEDLTGLVDCPNLNYVTLDYNNIAEIDTLAQCPNLVQVNVFGTYIHTEEDVSALLDRGIIVNFTPETE